MGDDKSSQSKEDKRKAHFAKAKKAVLEFARNNGGSCPMSDLHSFSESQYFIAHQQFSRLLEECVGEGLVEVEDNTVTLTDGGHDFAGEPDG